MYDILLYFQRFNTFAPRVIPVKKNWKNFKRAEKGDFLNKGGGLNCFCF